MRFLRSIYGWIKKALRAVFSRKGALVIGCLVALLVVAISLTHFFYNRNAVAAWAEVEERWSSELNGSVRDDLFERVPDNERLDLDQRVVTYFSQEEPPLGRIRYMPLGDISEYGFISSYDGDALELFDEGSFESEREAASYLLGLLDLYRAEIELFEEVIRGGKRIQPLLVDSMSIEEIGDGMFRQEMGLFSVSQFFADRGKYRILAGDSSGAKNDIMLLCDAYENSKEDPLLLNFLLHLAHLEQIRELFSLGVSEDVWDEATIEAILTEMDITSLHAMYQNVPAGEYFFQADFLNLYEIHGHQKVDAVLYGVYEDTMSVVAESGDVEWEILWLKVCRAVLPKTIFIQIAADTQMYALDHAVNAYSEEPHVRVYHELKEALPENHWWELSPAESGPIYVNQYLEFLKGVTTIQLVRCGAQLELHFIKHGEYPDSLEAVQGIRESECRNVYGEGSLVYEKLDGGESFKLYSRGPSSEIRPIPPHVDDDSSYNEIDFFEGM